jgi:bacterioferritin B
MLISTKTAAALNEQIGHEFGAMLQYVAIASYFETEGLPELAHHFSRQADEERDHAMRIVKYVVDADAPLKIPSIEAPRTKFKTAEEAVQLSLDWELEVTRQINELVDLTFSELKAYFFENVALPGETPLKLDLSNFVAGIHENF